jgi:dethiobiotin synthetase
MRDGVPARGVFVTGTDTGVGKTVLAAAIVAALRAQGQPVRAFKPAVTGTDELEPQTPADHELLAACSGQAPQEVSQHVFGPAAAPALAARLSGRALRSEDLIAAGRALTGTIVCEGVGGLLAPLTDDLDVRDYAAVLGFPAIVAARPGLGTVNHTLLTLEAARARALEIRAVVLTPWPPAPSALERWNLEVIAGRGAVEVAVLHHVPELEPQALAQAGRALPVERWLGPARNRLD